MKIAKIETEKAPKAVGPYSQAVVADNLIFCSGQIGLDPLSSKLVEGGVLEEAKQVIKNLQAVLQKAGSGLDQVVKTEIFLTDIVNFNKVNEIYSEFFTYDPQPARVTVEVSNLPKGAAIEISCMALKKE